MEKASFKILDLTLKVTFKIPLRLYYSFVSAVVGFLSSLKEYKTYQIVLQKKIAVSAGF